MVRPGRNWVQHKCDQLINNCDGMLNHLKQMHDLYTYGQDWLNETVKYDSKTDKVTVEPVYPEHAELVENLSSLVIMLQKLIKQFKSEHV